MRKLQCGWRCGARLWRQEPWRCELAGDFHPGL